MPFHYPAFSRNSLRPSLPGAEPDFDRFLRAALKRLASRLHPPDYCRKNLLEQAARLEGAKRPRRAEKKR